MILPLFYLNNMRELSNFILNSLVILLGELVLKSSLMCNCSSYFLTDSSLLFWNFCRNVFSEYCAILWWIEGLCTNL